MIELPYVMVFAHQKGGSGKSTTCMNVATEMSKSYDTTLIDFDSLRQTTKFNNNRENPIKQQVISNERELEEFLKKDKGLTIIDLGGYDSDLSRASLILADMIIIPMSDSDNDIDGFGEFMQIIQKIQEVRSDVKTFVLVNRVHHADKSTHRDLKEFASGSSFEVFDTVVRENKLHKRMIFSGQNVVEKQQFSKPAQEIQALVKEIIQKA